MTRNMSHITHFIIQFTCPDTHEELFAAHTDGGKIRVGYVGGPIKECPPEMVAELIAVWQCAADFDEAEEMLIDFRLL